MSEPLKIWAMEDIDKFIKINNLKEVTNPIYLQKNVPTPDGLLSYDIFGISTADRKTRMGYIDLKGHFMNPLAAKKLRSYDRRLDEILFSNEKYILTDSGDLVKNEDSGNTGPEFLYSIWGKVKIKEKDTITTKEVEKFYNKDRDKLFITKLPVIPAFYRDINDINDASKGILEINSKYSSIISYCQNLQSYTDTFTMMKTLTQARVQSILVELYDEFIIKKIKGQPAKYGMLRRFYMSKNIDYSARMVISAPILQCGSPEALPIKYGYAGIPLAYVCSCFYPFIIHALKKFFESEFILGGKYPIYRDDNKTAYVTIKESYDDEYISRLIERFIHSPSTRFEQIKIPPNEEGITDAVMYLTGRFLKENTTFNYPMTVTDLLYIVAYDAVKDKHVYVTRYPLDNFNGQYPANIHITTTLRTKPVIIGDKTYMNYPIIKGLPDNAFIDTIQMSNSYLGPMGADYDGDTVSIKPVFSIEANEDCEKHMKDKSYYLDVSGETMRKLDKDFILTAYKLTKSDDKLQNANSSKPKYII